MSVNGTTSTTTTSVTFSTAAPISSAAVSTNSSAAAASTTDSRVADSAREAFLNKEMPKALENESPLLHIILQKPNSDLLRFLGLNKETRIRF